jgi:NADPH:quinone reductase-like Zn-dependent oxidoreductase
MRLMKALVYDKKASPEKLQYREIEKPVPGDDEVLIQVIAASVNAADYRSIAFGVKAKGGVYGADVAGRVVSTGKNIRQFSPGDEVIGELANDGFGGFAEYVAASGAFLTRKPEQLSFAEAAALPLAGITALQALRDKGHIQPGQQVLIAGSGGGVGTFAVQLAKYFGAEVTAVCGSHNVAQTAALGADFVIDYTKEDFTQSNKRYDLILAVNGNRSLRAYKRLLKPQGTYVMVGGALSQIFRSLILGGLMSLGSKKMLTLTARSTPEDIAVLASLAAEGHIRAVIERRYPLDQTAEALKYVTAGHARGKVVIEVVAE